MAKRRKNGQMSDHELELRRFHKDAKKLKKICDDNNIELLNFEEANSFDICILSKNEYEIGATKEYVSETNEPYFVSEENFNKTQTLYDHE